MTSHTAHNISSFSFDGLIVAFSAMFHLVELSEALSVVATGIATITAAVRLVYLIRKGKDE